MNFVFRQAHPDASDADTDAQSQHATARPYALPSSHVQGFHISQGPWTPSSASQITQTLSRSFLSGAFSTRPIAAQSIVPMARAASITSQMPSATSYNLNSHNSGYDPNTQVSFYSPYSSEYPRHVYIPGNGPRGGFLIQYGQPHMSYSHLQQHGQLDSRFQFPQTWNYDQTQAAPNQIGYGLPVGCSQVPGQYYPTFQTMHQFPSAISQVNAKPANFEFGREQQYHTARLDMEALDAPQMMIGPLLPPSPEIEAVGRQNLVPRTAEGQASPNEVQNIDTASIDHFEDVVGSSRRSFQCGAGVQSGGDDQVLQAINTTPSSSAVSPSVPITHKRKRPLKSNQTASSKKSRQEKTKEKETERLRKEAERKAQEPPLSAEETIMLQRKAELARKAKTREYLTEGELRIHLSDEQVQSFRDQFADMTGIGEWSDDELRRKYVYETVFEIFVCEDKAKHDEARIARRKNGRAKRKAKGQ